jgi:rfaE bifunctional protein kinase chain/domain
MTSRRLDRQEGLLRADVACRLPYRCRDECRHRCPRHAMTSDRILVVGDSMLDCYWDGAVERISPEAPVPVLRKQREWQRAGGAANVAVNLAELQSRTTLATVLGHDEAGATLARLVEQRGVALRAVRSQQALTTQKIRAVCRQQQLLRVDVEDHVPAEDALALADLVADLLPGHAWLLLSDYRKGALRECEALISRALGRGGRVLVDPKGSDFSCYRGAWLLKPNEAEALGVVGPCRDDEEFETRLSALRESLELEHLLVTRGERGMTLFSAGRTPQRIAAEQREVYDVSGAGDTVLATLAWALAEGKTLDDAVRLANRAAGIVVGKFGTAAVSRQELENAR